MMLGRSTVTAIVWRFASGRVALAVTRQGSHRPGRARISASGSSADSRHPQVAREAIRSSDVDMLKNLDVFSMFPSIESADRRLASLHRVLRGEFPCFNGTIKALRLPAAHPAALRCLRLAVPQRSLVVFAPRRTSAPPLPGVGDPVAPAGISLRRRQDLTSSWGTPIVRLHMFSRRRQDCLHQTIRCRSMAPGM